MSSPPRRRLFVVNDPTLLRIVPSLAVEIGFNESVVLLQFEYLLSITRYVFDGIPWMYGSESKLRSEYFPFWAKSTLHRAIQSLRDQHLIIVGNYNKAGFDHTLWYSLDWDGCQVLRSVSVQDVEGMNHRLYQNEPSIDPKRTNDDMQMNRGLYQNEPTILETQNKTQEETQKKNVVVVALRALGLTDRQSRDAVRQHHLTLVDVESWAAYAETLDRATNPTAVIASLLKTDRLPPAVRPRAGQQRIPTNDDFRQYATPNIDQMFQAPNDEEEHGNGH